MSRTVWLAVLAAFALGAGVGWFGNSDTGNQSRPADRARLEEKLTSAEQETERLRREIEALRMEQAAVTAGAAQTAVALTAETPTSDEATKTDDEARALAKRRLADLEYRLSADPTNLTLLGEYLATAAAAGEHDAAIDRFKDLVAKHPDNADLITMLGQAYLMKIRTVTNQMEQGRLAFTALDEFSKALEKDETHFDARWLRSILNYNMPKFLGKLPRAIKDLEKMVEQGGGTAGDDRYARVYYLLGRAYGKAGRAEDAKKTHEKGISLFPGDDRLKKAVGGE